MAPYKSINAFYIYRGVNTLILFCDCFILICFVCFSLFHITRSYNLSFNKFIINKMYVYNHNYSFHDIHGYILIPFDISLYAYNNLLSFRNFNAPRYNCHTKSLEMHERHSRIVHYHCDCLHSNK